MFKKKMTDSIKSKLDEIIIRICDEIQHCVYAEDYFGMTKALAELVRARALLR